MTGIDTTPQVVDISAYAGDTLTVRVGVSGMDVAGAVWSAQVRADRVTDAVDAVWTITADEQGAWLVLDAPVCAQLVDTARARTLDARRVSDKYTGVWDVQVVLAGGAVRTLVQGALVMHADVTRAGV